MNLTESSILRARKIIAWRSCQQDQICAPPGKSRVARSRHHLQLAPVSRKVPHSSLVKQQCRDAHGASLLNNQHEVFSPTLTRSPKACWTVLLLIRALSRRKRVVAPTHRPHMIVITMSSFRNRDSSTTELRRQQPVQIIHAAADTTTSPRKMVIDNTTPVLSTAMRFFAPSRAKRCS